jgi:hypothetical protein
VWDICWQLAVVSFLDQFYDFRRTIGVMVRHQPTGTFRDPSAQKYVNTDAKKCAQHECYAPSI